MKTTQVFPNQKLRMNQEVSVLLRIRSWAFKFGDTEQYMKPSYDLDKAIKKVKREFCSTLLTRQNLGAAPETVKHHSQTSSMRSTHALIRRTLMCLPLTPTASNSVIISVTEANVRRFFRRVNLRKLFGSVGVPGDVLKTCATQLAEVFGVIFNFSLLRSEAPTCIKTAPIMPEPKKCTVMCLNNYLLVALT